MLGMNRKGIPLKEATRDGFSWSFYVSFPAEQQDNGRLLRQVARNELGLGRSSGAQRASRLQSPPLEPKGQFQARVHLKDHMLSPCSWLQVSGWQQLEWGPLKWVRPKALVMVSLCHDVLMCAKTGAEEPIVEHESQ